ncbi:MAG: CaiB/BaiF CoA transferase family protein [Ilumatobacteraceae bacterium]
MKAALNGITVLALEQAVAVPFATRQLADLGARVIKVERPVEGDFARHYDTRVKGLSSYFAWLNRSKESLALDLKSAEAQTVVRQLASSTDVVVQNLSPGATTRLGLSSHELRELNPRLITVDLTGYGNGGPLEDRKAYDLLIQAEAGLLSVTGSASEMVRAGISVADIAGGMYVYSAVLAALVHRGTTGEGTAIEVSLFDALIEWMGHPINYGLYTGEGPVRAGDSHPSIYPYGSFAAANGRVQFGIQNQREWEAFCAQVLQRPEVVTDSRFATNDDRHSHRSDLAAVIEEAFETLTVSEVAHLLDEAGIANGRVNSISDVIDHPNLVERDRWRTIESSGGTIRTLRPPAIMHGHDEPIGPIPSVGQHTADILRELGYSDDRISELAASGSIGI